MAGQIIIFILAVVVGFIYIILLRNLYIYEKDPFWKLILVAIIGGGISIGISLLIYKFIDTSPNFVDFMIKVAPIEEFSKFFAFVVLYYLIIRKDFDEIIDGIIYISAVALGFAIIENIFYIKNAEYKLMTMLLRSIFSVLGHLTFTGLMGVAFYIHVKIKRNFLGILFAFIIAVFLHGLYNSILLLPGAMILLTRILLPAVVVASIIFYKSLLVFSNKREKISTELFRESGKNVFYRCAVCDNSVRSSELVFKKISFAYCEKCNSAVFDLPQFREFLNYFRPGLNLNQFFAKIKNYYKDIFPIDKENKIIFNNKRGFISANFEDLKNWVENNYLDDVKEIIEYSNISILLKGLGFQKLKNTLIDKYKKEELKEEENTIENDNPVKLNSNF